MYIYLLAALGALLSAPVALVHAQEFALSSGQVQLEMRPRIIQPQSPVSFEIVSYNTDINRAQSTVFLDGEIIERGVGLKNFTLQAPRVGESSNLEVIIETIDQGTVRKQVTLQPSQVDLLYETIDSHAYPLYPGKKLPAHEAPVRVVALAYFVNTDGSKIDPKSLIYNWKIDNQLQQQASGYGKNTFLFEGSTTYRTRTIAVEVSTVAADLIARREIEIPAYDPVIRFYQEHPLWGLDTSLAITAGEPLSLVVPEMAIRSVPFFVSNADSIVDVRYDWSMNGQPLSTFGDRNVVNLRSPDNASGRAEVRLSIAHQNKIFQAAESVFTVIFGNSDQPGGRARLGGNESTNFFGTSN